MRAVCSPVRVVACGARFSLLFGLAHDPVSYRDLLGQDPFSDQALERQLTLIKTLVQAVIATPSPAAN